MFRSVYTKTLRDLRWGVLGWGLGLGILALVTAFGWATAYPDEASRAQLAAQIHGGLSAAQVFYGPPGDLDKLGGFVEWRVLGLGPVLLGIYLILAGTGMTRGAEETGRLEVVVATPLTRSKVLLQQGAALATALVIALAFIGLLAVAAGPISGETGPTAQMIVGSMANLGAAALVFAAVGLLAAQLAARRRAAALSACGVMALAHLANTLPLVVPALRGLRYLSPLYLYSRSSPLSNGHLDWLAFAGLLAVAALLAGAAWFASQRRDLFDSYHRRRDLSAHDGAIIAARSGPASGGFFLANPFGRGLRDAIGTTAAWAIGLSLLAVLLTALVPNVRQSLLEQSGPFAKQLEKAGLTSEKGILSVLLFSFLPPLATLFGVMLASSWAGDELNQRLELELATPAPRWRVFLERWFAAVAAIAVALIVVAVIMTVTIELTGVDVSVASVGASIWTLVVLTACVTAFGFAVASWRPGLTTAGAGGFVAIAYFWGLVVPLLGLPNWVRYLSVFGLYGSPLNDGVVYWQVTFLALLAAALITFGCTSFSRRDIAK